MEMFTTFLESDLPYFEPDGKIGLLATLDEQGLPHITLITAMQAKNTSQLMFGQFCEGSGKRNARERKKTGFLFMTLNKEVWRGKALWQSSLKAGPESELFNKKPMWRYNSYFSLHTIHLLDLVSVTRKEQLPMRNIVQGVVKTRLVPRNSRKERNPEQTIMNAWTQALITKAGALKFLAYVDQDGYPFIIPLLSACSAGTGTVLIPLAEYSDEVLTIPEGPVAFFAMDLTMETVLVKGCFTKPGKRGLFSMGTIAVEQVYNSMPPVAGIIYPATPLQPVTGFSIAGK